MKQCGLEKATRDSVDYRVPSSELTPAYISLIYSLSSFLLSSGGRTDRRKKWRSCIEKGTGLGSMGMPGLSLPTGLLMRFKPSLQSCFIGTEAAHPWFPIYSDQHHKFHQMCCWKQSWRQSHTVINRQAIGAYSSNSLEKGFAL